MIAWIDAHNHLQDRRLGDPEAVIETMRRSGIVRCVANATRESDWTAVEKLHAGHPDFILPAFGIHPWHAHTASAGWQDRLTELLEKHPLSSIGECGLDGWVESPLLEIQTPVFLDQLRIARDLDRPATIHCLKAWDPLFAAFENQSPPSRFLMHSFGGSIEIGRRLIPLGAYFSFSGYFLQPRKSKVMEMFRQLPTDRILVETDAPDMLPPGDRIIHPLPENTNHPANLAAIASAFADSLGLPPDELAGLTRGNFQSCFL
jgi:TatD DNase family protein